MKLISHRGLLDGPDKEAENNPFQIKSVLNKGFDCEIDVWFVNSTFFLGHDNPVYEIPFKFLEQPGLWIHAKNLDALYVLGADPKLNFFWHQEDDFTLTSQGFIWTFPGRPLTKHSVMVMPEWHDETLTKVGEHDCYAVCSDFVNTLQKFYNK